MENRNEDFFREQQRAMDRMREMNERAQKQKSTTSMPPTPPFVRIPNDRQSKNSFQTSSNNNQSKQTSAHKEHQSQIKNNTANKNNSLNEQFFSNIPLVSELLHDRDRTLLLGLFFILFSENSDKLLLYALLYILM